MNYNQYIAPYVLSLDIHVIVVGKTKERRKGKRNFNKIITISYTFQQIKKKCLDGWSDAYNRKELCSHFLFWTQTKQRKSLRKGFEDKSPSKEKFDLIKNKYWSISKLSWGKKRKASSFKTIIIKLQPSYLMWWLDKVSFEILSNLPRNV